MLWASKNSFVVVEQVDAYYSQTHYLLAMESDHNIGIDLNSASEKIEEGDLSDGCDYEGFEV